MIQAGPLRKADVQQLLRFGPPVCARIKPQCKTWDQREWLRIANVHIHGNVLQNPNYSPMAAAE